MKHSGWLVLFVIVLLPKVSLSQHVDSTQTDTICPIRAMNQCKGQLDSIRIKNQQTVDYLLEIMRALDIKEPDKLKLQK